MIEDGVYIWNLSISVLFKNIIKCKYIFLNSTLFEIYQLACYLKKLYPQARFCIIV